MKIIYSILIIVASLGVSSCDVFISTSNTRIVGGSFIDIQNAPHQVALTKRIYGYTYGLSCGGVLIKSDLVVTAAHCVVSKTGVVTKTNELRIYAGSTFVNVFQTYQNVRSIVPHKEYFSNIAKGIVYNDIALIKLTRSFKLSSQIATIALRNATVPVGERCTVTGWGSTYLNGQTQNQLMAATVPIYNKTLCSKTYQLTSGQPLHAGTICAGYLSGGIDACQGDSGGPLVCNGLLTGIVSYGNGCGVPGFPGVYAEVMYYQEWIATNSANSLSSTLILTILLQIISDVVLK